jgi:hypothetical protein
MTEDSQNAYTWLVNRIARKTKIKKQVIEQVLGTVADLEWDWSGSRYDIFGLQLETMLCELGHHRNPKAKGKT